MYIQFENVFGFIGIALNVEEKTPVLIMWMKSHMHNNNNERDFSHFEKFHMEIRYVNDRLRTHHKSFNYCEQRLPHTCTLNVGYDRQREVCIGTMR